MEVALHHAASPYARAEAAAGLPLAARTPARATAGEGTQDWRENFWNVWQSAGARPRLTAKVQVTSLT